MLPFFLFAILLLTVGYMICGVMTHAALRGERLASLGQLETAAFEYSLTGKRPAGVTKSLEIYDTNDASGAKLPPWLKSTTFSGMVWRDNQGLLVASRQFAREGAEPRTIVFVEPLDSEWTEQLQDKSGMTVRMSRRRRRTSRARADCASRSGDHSFNIDDDDNGEVDRSRPQARSAAK